MIVFDIDGTLSIVGYRKTYLTKRPPDWYNYRRLCGDDVINPPIWQIFCTLKKRYRVLIVTSRPEECRDITKEWFKMNGQSIEDDDLLMRADGDKREDVIIKPELIEPYRDQIICAFEDRYAMAQTWRSVGITCCHVSS